MLIRSNARQLFVSVNTENGRGMQMWNFDKLAQQGNYDFGNRPPEPEGVRRVLRSNLRNLELP